MAKIKEIPGAKELEKWQKNCRKIGVLTPNQSNQYGGGSMAPLSDTVVLKYELIVQLQSVKIANGQFYDIQCSSAMC